MWRRRPRPGAPRKLRRRRCRLHPPPVAAVVGWLSGPAGNPPQPAVATISLGTSSSPAADAPPAHHLATDCSCPPLSPPPPPSLVPQVLSVPWRLERRLHRCRQGAAAGAAGAERLDHRARHAAGGGRHHCAGAAAFVRCRRTTLRCALHPALVLSPVHPAPCLASRTGVERP